MNLYRFLLIVILFLNERGMSKKKRSLQRKQKSSKPKTVAQIPLKPAPEAAMTLAPIVAVEAAVEAEAAEGKPVAAEVVGEESVRKKPATKKPWTKKRSAKKLAAKKPRTRRGKPNDSPPTSETVPLAEEENRHVEFELDTAVESAEEVATDAVVESAVEVPPDAAVETAVEAAMEAAEKAAEEVADAGAALVTLNTDPLVAATTSTPPITPINQGKKRGSTIIDEIGIEPCQKQRRTSRRTRSAVLSARTSSSVASSSLLDYGKKIIYGYYHWRINRWCKGHLKTNGSKVCE